MSWVYVIVGIVSLIALQFLRSALSMAFPPHSARPTQRPDETSFGGLDLIDAKTEALTALGFAGPAWVGTDAPPDEAGVVGVQAAFRNAETGVVAWVGPTIEVAHPNSLLTYYTSLLSDGRYVVTQVSDPYFSAIDDAKTPAQTVEGSDEAAEIEAHTTFVASLGVPVARSSPRQDVIGFASEHMNAIRQRLIERGKLRETHGTARPSVGFALRILGKMLTRPKPAAAGELATPTSRLPFLSSLVEIQKKLAPSQDMQWLLLLISAALFVGIGWPFLGLEFTIIILTVIVLHEGGHWLAMRLYGYENPHITLLPLLGGVTIGHENDPSAAKRAWVALAGPLPGIVLGWGLLAYSLSDPADWQFMGSWAFSAVIVLLFVNYLNILPIPPLDGAHVAQAILPPRWSGVQAFVIILGVVLGIYVAYLLEFWPLALIAALQLPAIKGMMRTARLVREYAGRCPDGDTATRRVWLFEELQKKLGNPKSAAKRIALANNILHTLAVEPMARGQRVLVSAVYGALLVVPIGALALTLLATTPFDEELEGGVDYEAIELEYQEIDARAARLDIGGLVRDLAAGGALRPPASSSARLEVEARLGRSLPAHLAALYDVSDGLDTAGILPVSGIAFVEPGEFRAGDLQYYIYEDSLYLYGGGADGDIVIPVSQTAGWWKIGDDTDETSWTFVDPDAADGEMAVFRLGADAGAYERVEDLLRQVWASPQYGAAYEQRAERVAAERRAQLADLNAAELLGEFRRPSLLERMITREFFPPGPASPELLDATEARLGVRLPDDHRTMLAVHDGFRQANLLSAEEIRAASMVAEGSIDYILEIVRASGNEAFSASDVEACWVIGGHLQPMPGSETPDLFASLVWCPDASYDQRYVSTISSEVFPTFTDALREYLVRMQSF
ncbi:MAG: M50 family metallopeptidase [Woeseiaceae bacterium]|nr:M50 family metallopeptidase [Woeseiaceae bacterium]